MNIHTLGVDSFDMISLTTHVFHIDPCISLFTVRLEGSTCSNIQLLRPDGEAFLSLTILLIMMYFATDNY